VLRLHQRRNDKIGRTVFVVANLHLGELHGFVALDMGAETDTEGFAGVEHGIAVFA
jgi:hypothetical protein